MEIGIYSFGEFKPGVMPGVAQTPGERLRDLIEEVELADQVGLDVFGIGEHHRPDFTVSSPPVVLAAAASRTSHIRLSSAVTVLGSDDPVRVMEQFATLDQLSGGRAEIMAGRGSFIESFPLFGEDLDDYETLFTEKLDLLLALRESEHITWGPGRHRAGLTGQGVYPRPAQARIPVWIAVGGNPDSAARAGSLGLPMALAIIGGLPERFAPFAEILRRSAAAAGHATAPALGISSHGFIADTSQAALALSWPGVAELMNTIGRERGWPAFTLEQYAESAALRGAYFTGSPEQVIEKILFQHELFGHERFLVKFTTGPIPHKHVLRSIELLGTVVAPAVRAEVARRTARPA